MQVTFEVSELCVNPEDVFFMVQERALRLLGRIEICSIMFPTCRLFAPFLENVSFDTVEGYPA